MSNPLDKTVLMLQSQLVRDCEAACIEVSPTLVDKLIRYLLLMLKWNKTHNLTAITQLGDMLTKHLMDCLVVSPFVTTDLNLDIGTGAGLPGIPLALLRPGQQWVLLDSSHKRIAFITQVCGELSIDNVTPVHSRIEDYRHDLEIGTIISRAVSDIEKMLMISKHLMGKDTVFLAMKGKVPNQELQKISGHVKVHPLSVPRLFEQRHLVSIKGFV